MVKYIVGILIVAAIFFAFKQGESFGRSKAENTCKEQLLEIADQQKEIFITNEKIIIQYKQIEEKNRSLDIIELIDSL